MHSTGPSGFSLLPFIVAVNSLLEFCAPANATPIDRLATTASAKIVLVSRLDMSLPSDKRDGCCATSMTRRVRTILPGVCPPRLPLFSFQTGTTALRFHGRCTVLPSAISSARQITGRVSRGSITSSIIPFLAAM